MVKKRMELGYEPPEGFTHDGFPIPIVDDQRSINEEDEGEAGRKEDEEEKGFVPDERAIKRALSALLTQDSDTLKLFERGSRTYLKIFGGDINNFINLNSNLIQASIALKQLELLHEIKELLKNIDDRKVVSDK